MMIGAMTHPAELSSSDRLIEVAITTIEFEGEAGVRVDQVGECAGFTKPVRTTSQLRARSSVSFLGAQCEVECGDEQRQFRAHPVVVCLVAEDHGS